MTVRSVCLLLILACLTVLCSAVASFAQAPAPLPPHVVACTPAPFATNVDVNLAQVSLTFDRPMNTTGLSGFSPLRWFGVYPAAGKAVPTWNADGTVCSLPVKLDADATYAVAINTNKKGSFTDAAGAAALPFAWAFSTGARTPADFPTSVVSADPALAAADVDATKHEITLVFSHPLAPGVPTPTILSTYGASPLAGGAGKGGANANGKGRARPARFSPLSLSADRLTLTINVTLVPGTVYALGINAAAEPSVVDSLGRPVLPYAWCFKTAGTPPAPTAGGPAPGAGATPAPAK